MGHQVGKRHRPRRGSLQYAPRKRSRREYPRLKQARNGKDVKLLGFAGYKAGMTHVMSVEQRKQVKWAGAKLSVPVTIIETPPLKVAGFRLYDSKNSLTEVWADKHDKDLKRKIRTAKKQVVAEQLKKAESLLEKTVEIRLILHTNPRLAKIGKKKPEVFEISVGGSLSEAFNYAKEKLGKELRVDDAFSAGDMVDVAAVTKGKGFQGSVKRFGVKLLSRKSEKLKRKAGSLGPWTPKKVNFRTPQFGQMGYHTRVEFNKQVYSINDSLQIIGGIVNYGEVKNQCLLVKGSVPGAKKRLILLRPAIRSHKKPSTPIVNMISVRSQQ
jgi:large subunit ribosomal protein L3